MSNINNNSESNSGFSGQLSLLAEDLRINEALDLLEHEINLQNAVSERNELAKMRETYTLMLRYLTTGAPDPSRRDMTDSIIREILAMGDRLDFSRLVADSPGSYYSTARVLLHRRESLTRLIAEYDKAWLLYSTASESEEIDPDLTRIYEESLQDLFRAIMSTPPGRMSDGEAGMLVERASDSASAFALSSQIVSALILGLLEHYDRIRLSALTAIYSDALDVRVRAQALVGIVLSTYLHGKRIKYDRELKLRLEALADDIGLYPRIRDVYYSILQAQDTRRIIDYFKEKILPQIQKMNKDELKSIMEGSFSPEAFDNPEWAEKLEKSELGKKLRRLNEMQFEGADMLVMPFANLKMFPFFGSPGNWLLPFDPRHSAVRSAIDKDMQPIADFLEMADMMCDSDKYSFVLALTTIPSAQREMMISSLQANMENIKEQMESVPNESVFKKETVRYIRNLYRLFTMSSKLFGIKRGTPEDPSAMLEKRFDPLALPVFKDLLYQKDVIEVGAEFHFKRKNYSEALPLLVELENLEEVDPVHIWEKIGFIHEKNGDQPKAFEYYSKAELLNPDNEWLNRHSAAMLTAMGRYKEAEARYLTLKQNGDKNALAFLGLIYMKTGKFKEALKLFQQLEFEVSEGDDLRFSAELQPLSNIQLSTKGLTSLWLVMSELENNRILEAVSHLPSDLPLPFMPLSILLSFLQGDYVLTADYMKTFFSGNDKESGKALRDAVSVLHYFYHGNNGNPGSGKPISEETFKDELFDWFKKNIETNGASFDDFRLLLDIR